MTYLLPGAFAAMLVAALVLPTTADRLRGALGLPAYVLGAASLPFLPGFRGPSLTVWISAALLLLGPAMLLVAAGRAAEPLRRHRGRLLLVLLGVGAGVAAAWPTLDCRWRLSRTRDDGGRRLRVPPRLDGRVGARPRARRALARRPDPVACRRVFLGDTAAGRGRHGRVPGVPRPAALGPFLAADRRGPRGPRRLVGGRHRTRADGGGERGVRRGVLHRGWGADRMAVAPDGGAGVPDAPARGRGGARRRRLPHGAGAARRRGAVHGAAHRCGDRARRRARHGAGGGARARVDPPRRAAHITRFNADCFARQYRSLIMPFTLPALPYDYAALEPHIDEADDGDPPRQAPRRLRQQPERRARGPGRARRARPIEAILGRPRAWCPRPSARPSATTAADTTTTPCSGK